MINNRDTIAYLNDTTIQVDLAVQVLSGYISSNVFEEVLINAIADKNDVSNTALSKPELQIAIEVTDVVEQVRAKALRMLARL